MMGLFVLFVRVWGVFLFTNQTVSLVPGLQAGPVLPS